ncbi:MAG: hypothetical protein E5V25_08425 [Mesorhizobium sp.]|uniref:DUF6074 family protein n=1 Tax=unclassified Mesorhizobium TaxID=325217 RepID=UPI000FCC8925|nr:MULTISPECIES: DUF6074 family protein [unclassified Mesorhizobium]RUV50889.1 hypothetical protein EOA85_30380 [Mesorhizobium sp. M5C.F.Ca.IN.020.29.1.1]RWC21001.1 MAG: hypothetical protein EOS51_12685 [Mesorhizobium sp.]RWD75706.1 MAG: hypothetical protein EOS48_31630 [Mesorhizobium sp.]RWE52168.1 MAG: hypothetical protein EOS67_30955 [Mesorhizobium sp.]RWE92347.1 MAG: hypothetical protein EOS68_25875 [Mesorhizobium sp.]
MTQTFAYFRCLGDAHWSKYRQALETKNGEAASAFWRCAAKKMLIQLSDVGIAPELAAQEVGSLLHAVLDDMANRTVMHIA